MWRVLSFKTIISQNLKDTPLSLSVHPQLSVIPPRKGRRSYLVARIFQRAAASRPVIGNLKPKGFGDGFRRLSELLGIIHNLWLDLSMVFYWWYPLSIDLGSSPKVLSVCRQEAAG
jgi:hypothetical protein